MRIVPKTLPPSQYAMALFHAGRFAATREHWLLLAKSTVTDRSAYVTYARSAHRAYLNSLRLAQRLYDRLKVAA